MKHAIHHRNGFTLVEVTIACSLSAFLAVLLSTTWALLMRPTADLIAWGQIFQEMDVAVASLARDLGGSLPDYKDATGVPGQKIQGVLIECKAGGVPNDNHLLLCFDGGDEPDGTADWGTATNDTIIDYYRDAASGSLIRWNKKTDTTFTVATNVEAFRVKDVESNPSDLQIDLTFSFNVKATGKNPTRKCTLIAKKSP